MKQLMLAVGLSAAIVAMLWSTGNINTFAPSCTIGVTGTAATVTFRGWKSTSACASFESRDTYRLTSDAPTQPVICEYVIQGQTATVRDEGALKLIGASICADFARRADR